MKILSRCSSFIPLSAMAAWLIGFTLVGHAAGVAAPAFSPVVGTSVDITVRAVAMPPGTVLWSNPGSASGVSRIVPAVPSSSGVADVFAFQYDGTVQAITSDGATAWTTDVSYATVTPDFQGGLIGQDWNNAGYSIVKYDGMTGQRRVLYTPGANSELEGSQSIHPNGTILALQRNYTTDGLLPDTVVGIDSTTGGQKFSVPIIGGGNTYVFAPLMVAGDGNAYLAYRVAEVDGNTDPAAPFPFRVMLLRVDTMGASVTIPIKDYTTTWQESFGLEGQRIDGALITNADKGVLLSWNAQIGSGGSGVFGMAKTTGTSVSLLSGPGLPEQVSAIVPALQAQDASFIGTVRTFNGDVTQSFMIGLTKMGACAGACLEITSRRSRRRMVG